MKLLLILIFSKSTTANKEEISQNWDARLNSHKTRSAVQIQNHKYNQLNWYKRNIM